MSATGACTYEPVLMLESRKLTKQERKVRAVKVTGVVTVATLLVLLGLSGWASPSGRSDIIHSKERDVTEQFQLRSFPTDCPKLMKYGGCQKKAWSCEEDNGSMEWKCCCEHHVFQTPTASLKPGFTGIKQTGGARVFRLQTADVCLGGPDGLGGSFQFAACGKSNTRFMLTQSGAGPIHLASKPEMCVSAGAGGNSGLAVASCSPGASEQMFQLTDGTRGMIQWSSAEPKCLDSKNGQIQAGSGIELTDCKYYPVRPSQHFVLEVAPPEPKEDEDGKNRTVLDPPSLFCCSLMLPRTYEVGMLQSQLGYGKGVGIFACDEWAVYSNQSVTLRDEADGKAAVRTEVMNGSLVAPIGGAFHTALNTPVFRRFWQRVIKDPKAWRNDWIVKLDPDCVFFPDRLKEMLRTQWKPTGTVSWATWLNNCQLGLHGPIEVFNKHALGVYNNNIDKCDKVAKKHGQEDVYMAHCLDAIGVGKVNAYNLLLESEWACNERPSSVELLPPCFSHQVAFHPFKTVDGYFFCYKRAEKMSWSTPLFMISDVPSHKNHHHA